jgi:ubiquinone/menaquinone biosynthesis C-methylase UbiE
VWFSPGLRKRPGPRLALSVTDQVDNHVMNRNISYSPTVQDVREFWNETPCGTYGKDLPEGTPEYFAAIEAERYAMEPEIPRYAQFSRWRGKRVLEVGFGAGSDLMRFARAGAEIVGIDLGFKGAMLARKRIDLENAPAHVLVSNAEHMPLADDSFDLIYSWGVIHHSPNTAATVREIHRVLKPGGRITIMIYHTLSWVVFKILVKHGIMRGELLDRSWGEVFSRHSEYAPDNPLTRSYTVAQARQLFNQFEDVRVNVVPTFHDESGLPWAPSFGGRVGWFLVVRGRRAG